MGPRDTDKMATSADPDQSMLIWIYTVCPGLFVCHFTKMRSYIWMRYEPEPDKSNKMTCAHCEELVQPGPRESLLDREHLLE